MNAASFDKPVVIVGAGGHARVLVSTLLELGAKIHMIVDSNLNKKGEHIWGIEVIGGDGHLESIPVDDVRLVVAVGSTSTTQPRVTIYEKLKVRGFKFQTVVHPRAIVSPQSILKPGSQILAGAIVQAGAEIGECAIVNTGSIVEHDAIIEECVHVASGSVLCGNVRVGFGTHVGAGSTVIQNINIGRLALIGAGSVVVRDVFEGMRVMGVPAKECS